MFQMNVIGKKISELRKAKNMTQMELADAINISFQAVSSWERGNTMPDISKLPELARLLGVTVDELLGEKSELVQQASEKHLEEYLKNHTADIHELTNAAPILKPDQISQTFEHVSYNDMEEISSLLPFLNTEVIYSLIQKAFSEDNSKDLSSLLPFASQAVIDELGIRSVNEERSQLLSLLLPFLSDPVVSDMAKLLFQKGGIKALTPILPFIDEDELSAYIKERYLQ